MQKYPLWFGLVAKTPILISIFPYNFLGFSYQPNYTWDKLLLALIDENKIM